VLAVCLRAVLHTQGNYILRGGEIMFQRHRHYYTFCYKLFSIVYIHVGLASSTLTHSVHSSFPSILAQPTYWMMMLLLYINLYKNQEKFLVYSGVNFKSWNMECKCKLEKPTPAKPKLKLFVRLHCIIMVSGHWS